MVIRGKFLILSYLTFRSRFGSRDLAVSRRVMNSMTVTSRVKPSFTKETRITIIDFAIELL